MCISTAAIDRVGPADELGHLLERPHVDLGHGDHDRAVGHLRQRGRRVAGADVGHLAQRVELQLLQVPHVFHDALSLQQSGGVEDQRRRAIGEDRRPADVRRHAARARRTARPRCPAVRAARPPPARCGAPRPRESPSAAEPVAAAAAAADADRAGARSGSTCSRTTSASRLRSAVTGARIELHRLRHVGQRHRVALAAGLRQQRPHDRQRERHPEHEGRALPRPRYRISSVPPSAGPASSPRPRRPRGPTRRSPSAAVLNPGRREHPEQLVVGQRLDAPASTSPSRLAPWPGSSRGRCRGRRRLTRSATLFRSRVADSRIRPSAGLPALTPLAPAARSRDRPRSGSGAAADRRSRRASSDRARSPRLRPRTGSACPGRGPGRAPARGKRSNTSPTGVIRAAITSACIPDTSREIRSLSSAERRDRRRAAARSPSRFLRDDQLADLLHQARRAARDRPGSGGAARRAVRIGRRWLLEPRRDSHLAGGPDRRGRAPRRVARDSSRKASRPSNSSRSSCDQRRPHARTPGRAPRPAGAPAIARAPAHHGVGPDRDLHRAAARRVGRAAARRLARPRAAGAGGRRSARGARRRPRAPPSSAEVRRAAPARRRPASTPCPSASTARNSSWNVPGVGRQLRLPQRVEQVLRPVGQLGHAGEAHRRGHALDRVDRAEEPAHRRRSPPGSRSHSSSSWLQLLQVLAALGEEERGVLRDDPCAQPRTRCTASSTREGWNGLTTKSLAPAWIASTTSACCPMALHIRILASGSVLADLAHRLDAAHVRHHDVHRDEIGLELRGTSRPPARPISASPTTSNPACVRMSLIIVRMKMASSQTSTVWLTDHLRAGSG